MTHLTNPLIPSCTDYRITKSEDPTGDKWLVFFPTIDAQKKATGWGIHVSYQNSSLDKLYATLQKENKIPKNELKKAVEEAKKAEEERKAKEEAKKAEVAKKAKEEAERNANTLSLEK